MKKIIFFFLILFIFSWSATIFAAIEGQKYDHVFIHMSTSASGGGWYPFGGAIATIWEKYLPGITVTVQTSEGTPHNLMLLEQKMAEIVFLSPDIAYLKYRGMGDFEGKEYKEMRKLFDIMGAPLYLVIPKDSAIKNPLDLQGKRVGIGTLGGASLNIAIEALFDVYGLEEQGMNIFRGGRMDRAEALRDGRIDAGFFMMNLGSAVMMDLLTSGFVIMPLSDEYIEKIIQKYPYYVEFTITKDSYNLPEDIPGIGVISFIACDASFNEELAYDVTRVFFEHLDEIVSMYPPAEGLSIEDGLKSVAIPLHKGSERFFIEKGIMN